MMCGRKVRAAITRPVSRAPTSKIVALNLPTVLLVWERDYQRAHQLARFGKLRSDRIGTWGLGSQCGAGLRIGRLRKGEGGSEDGSFLDGNLAPWGENRRALLISPYRTKLETFSGGPRDYSQRWNIKAELSWNVKNKENEGWWWSCGTKKENLEDVSQWRSILKPTAIEVRGIIVLNDCVCLFYSCTGQQHELVVSHFTHLVCRL